MNKYVHENIKKQIDNDIYEIGNISVKIDESIDGKITDARIKENNNFSTYYMIYKNNKSFYGIFASNLTKEELIKKFDEVLNLLLNK